MEAEVVKTFKFQWIACRSEIFDAFSLQKLKAHPP